MRLTNFSMETGSGSTDSSGESTITLSGQYHSTPIITVIGQGDNSGSPDDAFGNTNVIIKRISKATGKWVATIASESNITFNYQAM